MKIEIEWTSSVSATIKVTGYDASGEDTTRSFFYGYQAKSGAFQFYDHQGGHRPPTQREHDNSIAGLCLSALLTPIINIGQALHPNTESPDNDCWGIWEILPDDVAQEVADKL